MYIFRRAAARAVSAPSQIRPATRVASFRSSIPSIARSFHQSQSQRKEAQDAVSESSGTTSEPVGQSEHQSQTVSEQTSESAQQSQSGVSAAQDAVSESSGSTSAPLGQSETSPQSVSEQASELAQKAQSTVAEAASTVADKAQEIPSQAQESFGNASRRVQSTASSARNAADKFNPFGGEIPKNRTLYVGNLFFETTTPQLEAEFGKFGEITNSRVITDNRGLSKGFGYIEFADQMAADEALAALDQTVLQGRRLSVQYHKRREGGRFGDRERKPMHQEMPPSKTLFIGNMSYQMSDRDLNDLFRNIRNVLDVRVAIDRRSGQPRGFAHADFIDIESAVRAKETLENKVVYGRNLRVNFSGAFRDNERRDHNGRKDDDRESF